MVNHYSWIKRVGWFVLYNLLFFLHYFVVGFILGSWLIAVYSVIYFIAVMNVMSLSNISVWNKTTRKRETINLYSRDLDFLNQGRRFWEVLLFAYFIIFVNNEIAHLYALSNAIFIIVGAIWMGLAALSWPRL